MKIVLAIVTCILLFSCSERQEGRISGTHDYESRKFSIEVRVYDDPKQLNKLISEVFDVSTVEREGFSDWVITKDMKNMDICTVHVVRPRHESDNKQFTTWGHELAHCVYGSFHEE